MRMREYAYVVIGDHWDLPVTATSGVDKVWLMTCQEPGPSTMSALSPSYGYKGLEAVVKCFINN